MTQKSETILDRIVADKRDELAAARERVPPAEMRLQAEAAPAPRGFAKALRGPKIGLIAEAKKASPSRGVLREDFDPVWLAGRYAEGGAAAISVLTDEKHFQGSLGYMRAVREALPEGPPVLRKDFTIDPYHLYEARANGADAVLLIAAILDDSLLRDLMAEAAALGLDALIEVHDERELARTPVTNAAAIPWTA